MHTLTTFNYMHREHTVNTMIGIICIPYYPPWSHFLGTVDEG